MNSKQIALTIVREKAVSQQWLAFGNSTAKYKAEKSSVENVGPESKNLQGEILHVWEELEAWLNQNAYNANDIDMDVFALAEEFCSVCDERIRAGVWSIEQLNRTGNRAAFVDDMHELDFSDDTIETILAEYDEDKSIDNPLAYIYDDIVCEGHVIYYDAGEKGAIYHDKNTNGIDIDVTLPIASFSDELISEGYDALMEIFEEGESYLL